MTREEYDALIKQKSEIREKLQLLDVVAWDILKWKDIKHRGETKVLRILGEKAIIQYREPGCSCCPSYETVEVPAEWMFSADYRAEIKAQKDEEVRLQAEKELEEAAQERLAQEQRDIEEFGRLKEKFEPKA